MDSASTSLLVSALKLWWTPVNSWWTFQAPRWTREVHQGPPPWTWYAVLLLTAHQSCDQSSPKFTKVHRQYLSRSTAIEITRVVYRGSPPWTWCTVLLLAALQSCDWWAQLLLAPHRELHQSSPIVMYIVACHLRRGFANSMAWGQYNGNGKVGSLQPGGLLTTGSI